MNPSFTKVGQARACHENRVGPAMERSRPHSGWHFTVNL
jgi:hypothetical protein